MAGLPSALLLFFIAFIVRASSTALQLRPPSVPLPPSQDPWYSAPSDYEFKQPGTVLRVRSAPGNLTTVFSNSSAVYNILYRTMDSHYRPSWAVTTLLVPQHTNASTLLSYQIPYNSADVNASPSYTLNAPVSSLTGIIDSDIQAALNLGWYVNVPDYEGPLAAFGAGVQSGHATLDSVRATLSLRFGLASTARYALWGYSGGSIASEWAAELQIRYAPELTFAGAALGGLVANLTDTLFNQLSGTRWAGLFPSALLGLTAEYPIAHEYLLSQLNPTGAFNRTAFLSARDMTSEQAFAFFWDQDMFACFLDGRRSLESAILQQVLDHEGIMGHHGVPQMPLFIYKAIADEVSPAEDTDALVQGYCAVGANVLYQRDVVGGHVAEEANGDKKALEWLAGVLGGTYEHEGCTIQDVLWNITDSPL